jgi:hypothetical protein
MRHDTGPVDTNTDIPSDNDLDAGKTWSRFSSDTTLNTS